MATPPPVRDAIAGLPPEQFGAFVAALWRARGRTVRREGERLHVSNATGTGERILFPVAAADDDRSVPDDVDVVVHAGESPPPDLPSGTTRLGPGDLVELLRYAVDDAARAQLVETHLDPSLLSAIRPTIETPGVASPDASDESPPASEAIEAPRLDPSDAGGTTRSRPRRRTLLVGAGAVLTGLGAAVGLGLGPFGDDSADTGASGEDGADSPAAAIPLAGLSSEGVTDAREFAIGHVDRLQDTSFRIAATKTIHADDGRLLWSLSLDARLARDRSFLVSATTAGSTGPTLLGAVPAQATFWSDRETYRRRVSTGGETTVESYEPMITLNDWYFWANIVPFDGPPYSAFEFYRDFFEVVPVTVERGSEADGGPYRLTAAGVRLASPPLLFDGLDVGSPIPALDVLGEVTRPGLIRSLQLRYDGQRDERPVEVRWTIEYDAVGSTTVERPDWADVAPATRTSDST